MVDYFQLSSSMQRPEIQVSCLKKTAVQLSVDYSRMKMFLESCNSKAKLVPVFLFVTNMHMKSSRQWFSGKIHRCHRWAPSSILGWRKFLFCIFLSDLNIYWFLGRRTAWTWRRLETSFFLLNRQYLKTLEQRPWYAFFFGSRALLFISIRMMINDCMMTMLLAKRVPTLDAIYPYASSLPLLVDIHYTLCKDDHSMSYTVVLFELRRRKDVDGGASSRQAYTSSE